MRRNIVIIGASGFLAKILIENLKPTNNLILVYRDKIVSNNFITRNSVPLLRQHLSKLENVTCLYCAVDYYKGSENWEALLETNVSFPLTLIENSEELNIRSFFYLDTFFSLYPLMKNNHKSYVLSKLMFNEIADKTTVNKFEMSLITVYIHHMYGINQGRGIVFKTLESLKSKNNIELSSCLEVRDFVRVEDVASALIFLIENINRLSKRDFVEIGTGVSVRVRDFFSWFLEPNDFKKIRFGDFQIDEQIKISELGNKKILDLGWQPQYIVNKGLHTK